MYLSQLNSESEKAPISLSVQAVQDAEQRLKSAENMYRRANSEEMVKISKKLVRQAEIALLRALINGIRQGIKSRISETHQATRNSIKSDIDHMINSIESAFYSMVEMINSRTGVANLFFIHQNSISYDSRVNVGTHSPSRPNVSLPKNRQGHNLQKNRGKR